MMLKLHSGRGEDMDETGKTRKSLCEIIRTLCEHALRHEYSSNPVGNLTLRIWRDRILDYASSGYQSLDDYLDALPGSVIPDVITTCKDLIEPELLLQWHDELTRQRSMSNKIIADYLYDKVEEKIVESLIASEEIPVINTRPL